MSSDVDVVREPYELNRLYATLIKSHPTGLRQGESAFSAFRGGGRITVMPPSPFFKQAAIKATLEHRGPAEIIAYSVDRIEFHDSTSKGMYEEIVSKASRLRLEHRSRLGAVAWGPLRRPEFVKRLNRYREYNTSTYTRAIREHYAAPLTRIIHRVIDLYLEKMEYSPTAILSYVAEHEKSSIMPGFKWAQLAQQAENTEFWSNALTELLRYLGESKTSTSGVSTPLFYGMRSRTDSIGLEAAKALAGKGYLDRCRIIAFNAALSMWNAFLTQTSKEYVYSEICKSIDEELKLGGVVAFPLQQAGQIYALAEEKRNEEFAAMDGKTWDAVCGTILPSSYRPFLAEFLDTWQVPSGETLTSVIDTIASSAVLAAAREGLIPTNLRVDSAIIHGDDVNIYPSGRAPAKPEMFMLEHQPEDSQLGFVLGLIFKNEDELSGDKVSVAGLKWTMDTAEKMVSHPFTGVLDVTITRGPVGYDALYKIWTGADWPKIRERLLAMRATDYFKPFGEQLESNFFQE